MHDSYSPQSHGPSARLSYKFQRLREQLRSAVLSGEFTGRLPGERQLGRRFNANAKTINKALCDLARDGLLSRHIGRGTFVNGPAGVDVAATKQYRIILSGASDAETEIGRCIAEALKSRGHGVDSANGQSNGSHGTLLSRWPLEARRSTDGIACLALDPFCEGAEAMDSPSAAEIVRRHLPIVMVGAQSPHSKFPLVTPDYSDAGFRLAEHMIQMGCRRIVIVSRRGGGRESALVASGAEAAAARHGYPSTRVCLDDVGGTAAFSAQVSQGAKCNCDPRVGPTGILCIGAQTLVQIGSSQEVSTAHASGHVHLAVCAAPGSKTMPEAASYEVSLHRIADWAARLLLESRAGDRPVEVILPGIVRPAQRSGEEAVSGNSRLTAEGTNLAEVMI